MNNKDRIRTLYTTHDLDDDNLKILIETLSLDDEDYLYECARHTKESIYGKDIYIRGLIEFTNYCKNDCFYCGIRSSNKNADRYRLSLEEILDCAKQGYDLGFRTFVLQGGEDPYFTDDRIVEIVQRLRHDYPDCAITLSIGEKSYESYKKYYDAGANRYLLRHETSNEDHYSKLHPHNLSIQNRKRCLQDLKDIGYQVGCGIIVESPYQTTDHIIEDIRYMQSLEPHMIGIGPFIPHKDTPFKNEKKGTLKSTLHLLAILRLMFPHILLPATTALGTIHPLGRELGIQAGANVIMPNLSPTQVRKKYLLYDGKICTEDHADNCRNCLENRMETAGGKIVVNRGDYK